MFQHSFIVIIRECFEKGGIKPEGKTIARYTINYVKDGAYIVQHGNGVCKEKMPYIWQQCNTLISKDIRSG